METNFWSQNTKRLYPFSPLYEVIPQFTSDVTHENDMQWRKLWCVMKHNIVDAGVTIFNNTAASPYVTVYGYGTHGLEFDVYLGDGSGMLARLLFTFSGKDFETVTARTAADRGGEIYGFVTIGEFKEFPAPPDQFPLHGQHLCRSCIRVINKHALTALYIKNRDRWIPPADCVDEVLDRPAEWRAGAAATNIIKLQPGYNCRLRVAQNENRVIIEPRYGRGMGPVVTEIPLGADIHHKTEREYAEENDWNRLDAIDASLTPISSLAGATGKRIQLQLDRNFVHTIRRSTATGLEKCPQDTLVIDYIRPDNVICQPVFLPEHDGTQPVESQLIFLPGITSYSGSYIFRLALPEPLEITGMQSEITSESIIGEPGTEFNIDSIRAIQVRDRGGKLKTIAIELKMSFNLVPTPAPSGPDNTWAAVAKTIELEFNTPVPYPKIQIMTFVPYDSRPGDFDTHVLASAYLLEEPRLVLAELGEPIR